MLSSDDLRELSARAALTAGWDMWSTRQDSELGIPRMLLSDGPNGVRGPIHDERHPALCTPCGTSLGASWDPDLMQRIGILIGTEARRQSVQVVLGPTINIQRSPLGGRGFESFSEDPLLAGRLAAAWIDGVQSRGVAACPKHFVANDSETSRTTIDCIVDERALREVYLAPFEHALRGGAWTMMASYNRINGTYACENRSLLTDLVRSEWGWDGLVVSDWFAAKDTVACARSGLDLEMPGPGRVFGPALARAVQKGLVPAGELDDKIDRLSRLADRVVSTQPTSEHPGGEVGPAGSGPDADLLVEAAAAGMVLLTNKSVLPFEPEARGWRLALIGPHAANACLQGGGSAEVNLSPSMPTLQAALQERFGPGADVLLEPGCADDSAFPPLERLEIATGTGFETSGVTVRFFDEADRLRHEEIRQSSVLIWDDDVPGMGPSGGRIEVSGQLIPKVTGTYVFSVRASGASRVVVDGQVVAALPDQIRPEEPLAPLFSDFWAEGPVTLDAGVPVSVMVEMHHRTAGDPLAILAFGCRPPNPPDLHDRAVAAAQAADAAVVVIGTGKEKESESTDRRTTALSQAQDSLVRAVLAVQPRTVVAVNAGAAVAMPWAEDAGAVLYCWFPGQGFAEALAQVLAGDLEPGGRLPVTLAAREQDYPALRTKPDSRGRLVYGESIFVGYRHFEATSHAPAFSFGHGLGYTSFDFRSLEVSGPDGDDSLAVNVEVRNGGSRPGKEVVQLYVAPPAGRLPRPLKELKAFAPVRLDPGEIGQVRLQLDERSFSHWNAAQHRWTVEAGRYQLLVGRSSADIRLRLDLQIGEDGLPSVFRQPDEHARCRP